MTDQKKLKIRFVINPISGVGRQKIVERHVDQFIDKERFDYEVCYTDAAGHAVELSREASEKGYAAVIAVGGDGSINEVARGVIGSNTAVGVIPVGSGNGLAHHLGIPFNLHKNLEMINRFSVKEIDTASINGRLFVSIAGVGFDAYVAEKFSQCKRRGFRSYAWVTFKEYLTYKPNKFKLMINGKIIKQRALLISFANSDQFGYNARIAPNANVFDGLLEVCVVRKFFILLAPIMLPLLFAKLLHKTPFMNIIRTSELKIIQYKNYIAHIDGDQVRLTKSLEVKVNPHSLRLIMP